MSTNYTRHETEPDPDLETVIHRLFERGAITSKEREVLLQTYRSNRLLDDRKEAILEKYRETEQG